MKMILAPIDFSAVTARVVDEVATLAQAIGYVARLDVVRPIAAAAGYKLELQHVAELNAALEREVDRQLDQHKITSSPVLIVPRVRKGTQ